MKRLILSSVVLAALAGVGCEAEVHPAPVVVGAEYNAGPDDVYYQRGAYVGTEWVWHDSGGREYREARDVHEQRAAKMRNAPERHDAQPAGKDHDHDHDRDDRR